MVHTVVVIVENLKALDFEGHEESQPHDRLGVIIMSSLINPL